jgi:hypothetical protein
MPSGTTVDTMYRALLKKGYSVEKAARISQSVTGLSLKTGKKPQRKDKK